MKVLALASVLDVSMHIGCTPAWWQLLKGLHEIGVEVIATCYYGQAVESLWWRAYPNPCYRLGNTFASLRKLGRILPGGKHRASDSQGGVQRFLINRFVKPRWRRQLFRILEHEKDVDALLILTVPFTHLAGIPNAVRERFGIPVVYYDGDLPASLPRFGGFATGFNIYQGADLGEYDVILSNSQGAHDEVRQLGAKRTATLWWAADPGVFRPVTFPEDIDVFFYGIGTQFREDWIRDMITIPSSQLPERRFVVSGTNLDIDLGRAERIPLVPLAQIGEYVGRSRINVSITRKAHASVYASATCRIFELAAMQRAIVTNPMLGLQEWFEPGKEVEQVESAGETTATYARLLGDETARQALATAARERVLRQHTYNHRARELLEVLRSVKR